MTAPNPSNDVDWLGYYKRVEGVTNTRLRTVLVQAALDAERVANGLAGRGIGATVQRAQIMRVRKQLRLLIKELFVGKAQPIIREGRLNAVGAAARASMAELEPFFREIFPNSASRKAFQTAYEAQARRSIDTMMTRVQGRSYVPLSQAVYKTSVDVGGRIDRIVNSNLARGTSAKEIAAEVKSFVNPATPGGASYAAMRLGRTELNNAFHAQSIAQAQDSPFVDEMEWNLSGRHKPDPKDPCETYALQGTFAKEDVPVKPHPNCLCYVTPKLVSWGEFRANLLAGQYDGLSRAVA